MSHHPGLPLALKGMDLKNQRRGVCWHLWSDWSKEELSHGYSLQDGRIGVRDHYLEGVSISEVSLQKLRDGLLSIFFGCLE